MLTDALKILSQRPVPGEKLQATADANARISALESQLGLAHKLPTLNPAKALARLTELESQLAAEGLVLTPAALAPISAATAPVARPVELTGDPTLDKAIAASGCRSLAHYSAKAKRDKLFAAACALPPGSLSRACAESNLAEGQTELNDCK
jgi:hypothetical protein